MDLGGFQDLLEDVREEIVAEALALENGGSCDAFDAENCDHAMDDASGLIDEVYRIGRNAVVGEDLRTGGIFGNHPDRAEGAGAQGSRT
jgi:hypothetical protein